MGELNTLSKDEILLKLKTFIVDELLEGQDSGLDAQTPLLEWGVLDSLSMVTLLAYIEENLKIKVPDNEVKPENFHSLEALTNLLVGLTSDNKAAEERPREETQTGTVVQILTSYGVRPQVIDLPGSEQHYLHVTGKKPTWVLVPPLGNPSTSWGTILRGLIDEQETVAVDLAGFGLSGSLKDKTFTYKDHIEETLALLERVAEPPMVLIASSLGAVIATEIARLRPQWVRALIVVGFGLIEDGENWWTEFKRISRNLDRYVEHTYYQPLSLAVPLRLLLDSAFTQPEYENFLDSNGVASLRSTFDNINKPTLFIAGEDDRIVPKSAVQAAAERVPGARLEFLSRCGHFPQMERPTEMLLLIQNFLKTVTA